MPAVAYSKMTMKGRAFFDKMIYKEAILDGTYAGSSAV